MTFGFAFFPGQGAQAPGMGKTLFDGSVASRQVFECASDVSGIDVAGLCFNTTPEVLSRTENSQIAIFTHSLAALAALQERGVAFEACAGFSLGEYTALVASGVMSLADGVRIVQKRGQLMQAVADQTEGGMAAVLGLDDRLVEEACVACSDGQCVIMPVNYNCPGQLVVAGDREGLDAVIDQCKAAGARRAVPLAVSGAFHTPLMADAAAELRLFAEKFSFQSPCMPVYSNLNGKPLATDNIPAYLERHMISPVRWKMLVQEGIANGLTSGCEIGPGKTLTGFARKISKDLSVLPVSTMEDVLSVTK